MARFKRDARKGSVEFLDVLMQINIVGGIYSSPCYVAVSAVVNMFGV